MDHLPRKAIAATPELADRTPFAFVVDSFLVRTAQYAVCHYDRARAMFSDEFQDLLGNTDVFPDITRAHMPIAHLPRLRAFRWHNTDSNFRCLVEVRTVECDRRNRPTSHTPLGFLTQPLEKSVVSQGRVLTFHTSSTAIVDLAAVADVSGLLMTMPSLIHPTRLGMLYAAFAAARRGKIKAGVEMPDKREDVALGRAQPIPPAAAAVTDDQDLAGPAAASD